MVLKIHGSLASRSAISNTSFIQLNSVSLCVNQIFKQILVSLQRCHQKMQAYILTMYVTPEE